MISLRVSLFWTLLLTVSTSFPISLIHVSKRQTDSLATTPLPPTKDPFYTAPENFESTAPGAVLRFRTAPGNLTSVTGNCSAAYNILYRTTDSHYKASWAVTTVFVPHSPNKHSPDLLSYQIPYNSVDLDASPSYALYTTPFRDISNALGLGWYVNVPDFEGPLAAFTAGVTEGHATLDSVRAVLTEFSLPSSTKYAMWGYSGGSIASEWAAELQVQYAPELHFSGAALGGLPPNVTTAVQEVNGAPFAALIPEGLLDIERFVSVEKMPSILEAFTVFNMSDIYGYFTNGAAVLEAPVIQSALNRDGVMGYHGVPQMPLFVYKAIADEVSPINETDALVARYCAVGANILYERNTIGGHYAEDSNGDARALEWLKEIFAGNGANTTGCVSRNVAVGINSPI